MDITQRARTVVMLCLLARQLDTWLQHARDMGHLTREFKHRSGILLNNVRGFNNFLDKGGADEQDAVLFEESAKYAELVEHLLALSDQDLYRINQLIEKIKREKINESNFSTPHNG